MTTLFRFMTVADLDAVMALAHRSPGAPHWTRCIYQGAIEQEQSAALVAIAGEALVGFVIANLVLDICELESIVVAPEFRRQKIGAALLDAIIVWSRQRSAQRIELEVRARNMAAIALYERTGFLRQGIRRSYYSDPQEDAVLMALPLGILPKTVEKNP
jgi:ribosomal-protein-alanine N-acetyltransferase